jgi:chromosome segregation ATPase
LHEEGYLGEDEGDDLGAEPLVPVQPVPGKIRETLEAERAATARANEASAALDDARARLQRLLENRPRETTTAEVPATVEALREWRAEVSTVGEEIEHYSEFYQKYQEQAIACRRDLGQLRTRGYNLSDRVIPAAREELAKAQQHMAQVERDTAHALTMARKRVESQQRVLTTHEAELRGLVGE